MRRDGQKVLLAILNMGGESEAAWRAVLDDLVARNLATPELLIVDGAPGLEAAIAALWPGVPVQRRTVHKERNLLAPAPQALHEEIKADYSDMMYAKTAGEAIAKRKAFLEKWRLRCRGVGNGLEEAGERLYTLPQLSAEPMEVIAHHQRDRAPARGVQAPDQDPVRPAHSRNGGHVVLGLAGLRPDHPATGRRLGHPPCRARSRAA